LSDAPEIRAATLADAAAIARLVNDAFLPERLFRDADRTDQAKVAAFVQKGKFFMLFEEGALTGCIYTELRGDRGYFGLLAVDPQRQRSGIGARLIDAAERYCRSTGCRFMDLTFVNVRQELSAYYQRFGYVESGTLPFPADRFTRFPVHLVQMSKPL
jgi:GNAT superfamily N-acetyltransferase